MDAASPAQASATDELYRLSALYGIDVRIAVVTEDDRTRRVLVTDYGAVETRKAGFGIYYVCTVAKPA